jgi:phage major head subunit gpT-like protein
MAGIITTGSNPKLLWPGLNKIWGNAYELHDAGAEWKQIFEVEKSTKNYEETVALTTLGLAPIKTEADAVQYDTMKQSFMTRFYNITYALGFIVSQEEMEDNQYPDVAPKRTKALAQSMAYTQEVVGANVLNNAFSGSFLFGDGRPLCDISHPTESGTFNNELIVAADLSEKSLEEALIDIGLFVDSRGKRIKILPKKLIVPIQLQFQAERLLKNENRPETANRDINALVNMNLLPEGFVVNHYLTDPDAWFIKTNCPTSLTKFDRIPVAFTQDNDFDTTNAKYKSRTRFSFGCSDVRGIYGSPGA